MFCVENFFIENLLYLLQASNPMCILEAFYLIQYEQKHYKNIINKILLD